MSINLVMLGIWIKERVVDYFSIEIYGVLQLRIKVL